MAYATVAQFKSKTNYKSLPNELRTDEIISEYLEDATAEIYSYIRCSYQDLIAPYDAAITKKCVDLAYYYLMSKRGFTDTTADQVLAGSYDQIIKYLKDIANRNVILDDIKDSTENLLNDPFVIE